MPKLFGTSIPKESRLTEQRNKASRNLDRIMSREIVALINREDRKVAVAVGKEIPAIARAVDAIVAGVRKGGGPIYAGAGSSGRMAGPGAAEWEATVGTAPERGAAPVAGGARAITPAGEGRED